MNRSTFAVVPALLACASAFAQEKPVAPAISAAPAAPAAPKFHLVVDKVDLKDGDNFVFLGDSITHQCLYTQYVEDFFYTRFPKAKIHFHNAGVGGDRAQDAITRFDEDVAAYKPKYVTILLGMNDGAYKDFDKAVFDTYQTGMNTILDKISGLGATAIPMTPTMFDARAKRLKGDNGEPRNTYYNGVLSLYGTWLREEAEVRGLGFVDMWSPLNNLTITARKKDPNFTMIADGVHPGAAGQAVMAAAIVDNMVPHPPVSQTTVQLKENKFAGTVTNGTITDVAAKGDGVSFSLLENALPWVLPADALAGAKMSSLGHRYGNEKVTVRNLKPGSYELKIDGNVIGKYTDGQLGFGVELEENDKTPMYEQALKVAMLNKERNDVAYHPLRDQYSQLKGKRRDLAKIDPNAPEYAAKKAEFEAWYATQKAKVAELLGKAKEIEAKIYEANQPVAHKFEVAVVP